MDEEARRSERGKQKGDTAGNVQKNKKEENNKEKLDTAVVLKCVKVIIFSWSWQIFRINILMVRDCTSKLD